MENMKQGSFFANNKGTCRFELVLSLSKYQQQVAGSSSNFYSTENIEKAIEYSKWWGRLINSFQFGKLLLLDRLSIHRVLMPRPCNRQLGDRQ